MPNGLVNIGTGKDHTIAELAETVRRVVGYEGEVQWDTGKPDGTPQKLLDVSLARSLGWAQRSAWKRAAADLRVVRRTNRA